MIASNQKSTCSGPIGHIGLPARWWSIITLGLVICIGYSQASAQDERPSADNYKNELPWDFKPYNVLIWIAGIEEQELDGHLAEDLSAFIDRDFRSTWRTTISAAPPDMAVLAARDFAALDYGTLTAQDPVVVIKRTHPEAARIRFKSDVGKLLEKILVAKTHADVVVARGEAVDNAELHGMAAKFEPADDDLLNLVGRWQDETTEGILLPRGMAIRLDPEPKIMELDVENRMGDTFSNYDKLFIIHVDRSASETRVRAREIDCLLRHLGPIISGISNSRSELPSVIGRCVRDAFAPMVRFDEVGTKEVGGLLRASGLIMSDESPCNVVEGDFIQPLLRRNDRTGEPALLGVIDWTYLNVTKKDNAELTMEMHSGRPGALAGRRNNRTFRIGLKVRPVFENTVLRLHAKGNPAQALAGYDVFEKDLETKEFTKVGQTDWDGRLLIEKTENPMRLLYVKNGISVLARLPMVPGQTSLEAADLVGDDIRLEAESYIRGIQNAIIDLVGIRQLLANQIRGHIASGNFEKAQELLDELREQPSYSVLADDMGIMSQKITSTNPNEQAKIQQMFGQTRDLLVEHINPALANTLDRELIAARGGKAPPPSSDADSN